MSISPTLGEKLLSIIDQFPNIARERGSGGVIDRCIKLNLHQLTVHCPCTLGYMVLINIATCVLHWMDQRAPLVEWTTNYNNYYPIIIL